MGGKRKQVTEKIESHSPQVKLIEMLEQNRLPLFLRFGPRNLAYLFIITQFLLTVGNLILLDQSIALVDFLVLGLFGIVGTTILYYFIRMLWDFSRFILGSSEHDTGFLITTLYTDSKDLKALKEETPSGFLSTKRYDLYSIVSGLLLNLAIALPETLQTYFDSGSLLYTLFSWYGVLNLPLSGIMSLWRWGFWTIIAILIMSIILTMLRTARFNNRMFVNDTTLSIYRSINVLRKSIGEKSLIEEEDGSTHVKLLSVSQITTTLFLRFGIIITVLAICYSILFTSLSITGRVGGQWLEISSIVTVLGIVGAIGIVIASQRPANKALQEYKKWFCLFLETNYQHCMSDYMKGDRSQQQHLDILSTAINYSKDLDTWPMSFRQALEILVPIMIALVSTFLEPILVGVIP